MPDFQVSITDSNNDLSINIDNSCETLTVVDEGNYVLSDESGHLQADFTDFRQFTITNPAGQDYLFDAEGNGDETVSTASSGNHTINYSIRDGDKDGVYTIKICSIPTYNNAATYEATTDFVWFNTKLYQSLTGANTGNQPDTSPINWLEVTIAAVSEKYCITEKVTLTCIELLDCYEQLVHDAACVIHEDFCNPDLLCKNKTLLNAVELRLLLDAMNFSSLNKQWDEAQRDANNAKRICNCH